MLVGHLGNWRPAAAVLFERHSLSGNPPPCRNPEKEVAGTFTSRANSGGWGQDVDLAASGYMRPVMPSSGPAPTVTAGPPYSRTGHSRVECEALAVHLPAVFGGNNTSGPIDVSPALNAHGGASRRQDFASEAFIAHTLRGEGFDGSEDGTGRANLIPTADGRPAMLAFAQNSRNELRYIGGDGEIAGCLGSQEGMKQRTYVASVALRGRDGGATAELSYELATALRASQGGGDKSHVLQGLAVRRLTVRETERLQGFPDDYTLIPWRGKSAEKCPDGPRYKAIGNSMAVPVMRWIGERIVQVHNLI